MDNFDPLRSVLRRVFCEDDPSRLIIVIDYCWSLVWW